MIILTLLLSDYHPEPVAGVKPDKTAQRGAENVGIIGNTAFVEAVGTQCGWTVEGDGTVKLTPENLEKIRAVTRLNIGNQGLTDLSGIEWFTALTDLACNNNQLTTLDMSPQAELMYLDCSYNELTELNVSKNTELATLFCDYNQLTTLDVSRNTELNNLNCSYNPGDGVSSFPVTAWFDNASIPSDISLYISEWWYDGSHIFLDFRKAE